MTSKPTAVAFAVPAFLLLSLAGCVKAPKTYYPLEKGRSWQYRVSWTSMSGASSEATLSLTNRAPIELKGKRVTPQEVDTGGQRHFSFIGADDRGIYQYATQSAEASEPEIKASPFYYIQYPVQVGTTWETPTETKLLENNVAVTLRSTVQDIDEVVTVPAGTFERCVRVEGRGQSTQGLGFLGTANVTVEHMSWYGLGIGLIKSIIREARDGPFAASQGVTMELESVDK